MERLVMGLRKKYRKFKNKIYAALNTRHLPVNRLMWGDDADIPGNKLAIISDNPLRSSTHISQMPHVKFLKLYLEIGHDLLDSDELFYNTDYYKNARFVQKLTGRYFWAKRSDEIKDVAANFINMYEGKVSVNASVKRGQSINDYIVVRKIKDSSGMYQIIDGHHRAAISYVRGDVYIKSLIDNNSVHTILQKTILDGIWTKGEKILYQPVDAPEINDEWILVRKCVDRMHMMKAFIEAYEGRCDSYLDIGSSYGWFVNEMKSNGFDSYGVEIDKFAIDVGAISYSLDRDRIFNMDIGEFLRKNSRKYDIVSCYSVIHHYALGLRAESPEYIIGKIDDITNKILFFDMGESHEAWFRKSLRDWDRDYILDWLSRNTTFDRIEVLGRDSDNVGRYKDQYRRHLFVCYRL